MVLPFHFFCAPSVLPLDPPRPPVNRSLRWQLTTRVTRLRYLVLADPALRGAGLGELHPEVLLQRAGRGQPATALPPTGSLALECGLHQLAAKD